MKKFLKIIKIAFITIFGIGIILFLYFFVSNKMFLETKNQQNISYLSKNKVQIADSIPSTLFDDDFYKSKVFLLGEIHGYADNQTLDKELFFYLNKKLGVRYYISEMDSLTAKKLNNFLTKKTKDEKILKEVVLSVKNRIPQQSSQELLEKWNEIYDYNQMLTDSLKIFVIGIDKNFDDDSKVSRDLAMFNNFERFVKSKNLGNEKFYGLFGYFHTLQSKTDSGGETFAEELKKSGVKTTSFVSYTVDSEMYLPKNPSFHTPDDEKLSLVNGDGPLVLIKGINDLKELSRPATVTLFKLNSLNSPYFKTKNLISIKSRAFAESIIPEKEKNTTDYFQYVFLLRNSKALTKLR